MLNELSGAEIHGQLVRTLRKYTRPALLMIDDFAVLSMGNAQARLAFQVVSERYDHRRSTCITSNCLFKDWSKVFPDPFNAQVIAERLTERAEVLRWTKPLPPHGLAAGSVEFVQGSIRCTQLCDHAALNGRVGEQRDQCPQQGAGRDGEDADAPRRAGRAHGDTSKPPHGSPSTRGARHRELPPAPPV